MDAGQIINSINNIDEICRKIQEDQKKRKSTVTAPPKDDQDKDKNDEKAEQQL